MDCYLKSVEGFNKNIHTIIMLTILQCLAIHHNHIYSYVIRIKESTQSHFVKAASSKMIKPFQSTNDRASLCSGVRGYFVRQYVMVTTWA